MTYRSVQSCKIIHICVHYYQLPSFLWLSGVSSCLSTSIIAHWSDQHKSA